MFRLYSGLVILSLFTFACAHKASTPESAAAATPPPAPATAPPAKTESDATKGAEHLECHHKDEVRILVVQIKEKGCELIYTKGGQDSAVASGHHGTKHCQKVLEKIAQKLKDSGYECK